MLKVFEKIYIKGIEDIPKTAGMYYCEIYGMKSDELLGHTKGRGFYLHYDDNNIDFWLDYIRWYMLPIVDTMESYFEFQDDLHVKYNKNYKRGSSFSNFYVKYKGDCTSNSSKNGLHKEKRDETGDPYCIYCGKKLPPISKVFKVLGQACIQVPKIAGCDGCIIYNPFRYCTGNEDGHEFYIYVPKDSLFGTLSKLPELNIK